MSINSLADEVLTIYTEWSFTARWTLIEMYHKIGELIVSQRDTVDLKRLSNLTTISERNLYRATQFYKKYADLNLLPEGKDVSWHKIVNKYLPEGTKELKECEHQAITICKKCKVVLD